MAKHSTIFVLLPFPLAVACLIACSEEGGKEKTSIRTQGTDPSAVIDPSGGNAVPGDPATPGAARETELDAVKLTLKRTSSVTLVTVEIEFPNIPFPSFVRGEVRLQEGAASEEGECVASTLIRALTKAESISFDQEVGTPDTAKIILCFFDAKNELQFSEYADVGELMVGPITNDPQTQLEPEAPKTLTPLEEFSATTAPEGHEGYVSIVLRFASADSYGRIEIKRHPGPTLPDQPCATGVSVRNLSGPDLITNSFEDQVSPPGALSSYVACVYDDANVLADTYPRLAVSSRRAPSHLIFVTSKSYAGDTVYQADAKCRERAQLAGLAGTFRGLYGRTVTNTSGVVTSRLRPKTHLNLKAPIYNVMGELIAATPAAFWDPKTVHVNPVLYNEFGVAKTLATSVVWTGATATGNDAGATDDGTTFLNYTCQGFKTKTNYVDKYGKIYKFSGQVGYANKREAAWVAARALSSVAGLGCSNALPIYCVSIIP